MSSRPNGFLLAAAAGLLIAACGTVGDTPPEQIARTDSVAEPSPETTQKAADRTTTTDTTPPEPTTTPPLDYLQVAIEAQEVASNELKFERFSEEITGAHVDWSGRVDSVHPAKPDDKVGFVTVDVIHSFCPGEPVRTTGSDAPKVFVYLEQKDLARIKECDSIEFTGTIFSASTNNLFAADKWKSVFHVSPAEIVSLSDSTDEVISE